MQELEQNPDQDKWWPQLETVDSFQEHVQEQSTEKTNLAIKITNMNKDLNEAIQYVCSSQEIQDQSTKNEIDILNINLDDLKIDIDLYKKIINKFHACIRHQIYSKLKKYWAEN